MTKPAGDPSIGPAPTARPNTPALVRSSVAALALGLGLAGCSGGDPVPPQVVPPQAPPPDVTIPTPPQVAPPPMPPQVAPPPNQPNVKKPQESPPPPNQR